MISYIRTVSVTLFLIQVQLARPQVEVHNEDVLRSNVANFHLASDDMTVAEHPETLSFTRGIGGGKTPPSSNKIIFSSTSLTGGIEDMPHICQRQCNSTTPSEKCYYKFKIEHYLTMSKACYDCPFNATDCMRHDCIPADGRVRTVHTINRKLPGPSIQVCEGDEIIVDVHNGYLSDSTTVHWHGQSMKGTQYMDGVPFVTQCPINPGSTFRYHFIADPPGTHYWHSHSGIQRSDGHFGLMVIRSKNDAHSSLYDEDNPRHIMVVTDWSESPSWDKFAIHHHLEKDNLPENILVNGLGKYKPLIKDGTEYYTPLQEYRVTKGLRYRFRTLSNSVENCPIEISIDNHTLLLISSDGQNLKPRRADSLVIYGGERWDFVLNADQPQGVYWIKFRGLLDCGEKAKSVYQVAILRYEGVNGLPDELQDLNYDSTKRDGFQLNRPNDAPGDERTFASADQLRSDNIVNNNEYSGQPDHQFWLNFDFEARNDGSFHKKYYYPFWGVEPKRRVYMPQITNISLVLPDAPVLSQPEDVDPSSFCNAESVSGCDDNFCSCFHVLDVKLGSLVEMILIDTGVVAYANHPFHLHGHVFAVLGMDRLGDYTSLQAVKDLDKLGKLRRNFDNPPLKDTVTVPDGGYTVVRFRANNPGYWFLHCHLSFHVEIGMGLIVHVGEKSDLPPVPEGFPKCKPYKSYTPNPVENLQAEIDKSNRQNNTPKRN